MGGDAADARVMVGLLGPVEIGPAGGPMAPVPQSRLRVLLGLLGVAVGRVVSVEALVDGLWGEDWSPGREKNLHSLVYQLRRRLTALEPGRDGQRLARAGPGYRLALGPSELDVAVFRELAGHGREAARAGDTTAARELFAQALKLWRGAALADATPLCPVLAGEAARLEEQRLAVVEEQIECDLALGRHAEVAAELAALAGEFPLRERLTALLMTALYRCGRRGEALAAYDTMRRVLAEELGLDPGPDLAALQAKILADDPALAAPAPASAPRPLPMAVEAVPEVRQQLAERADSLASLEGLLGEAAGGSGRLVFLGGEAGVGKTTLAAAFAGAAGMEVVRPGDLGPASDTAAGLHGFSAALTSFIGREGPVREVTRLLDKHRLVTVTGPGGSGKTRLAGEVARRVAGGFADGVWLIELATVQDPAQVPAVVAALLGVRDLPGTSAAEALGRVLARRQLLLVLDNCEHVIGPAAELCAVLLPAADDVRVLATSREPLRVPGEARYRLAPLALPDPNDLANAARAEAVALFVDRARNADAHFALDAETAPVVARLVTRLDGMPLAIELAAARVEALGVTQLLERIEDRFTLLVAGDRLAADRQRSLSATVAWSYQLLDENEQRVFRLVSVFPGPFTLDAAEAVAGAGAGPAVLHLVDCSLLSSPRADPDGRSRYGMLETVRAYGAGLLAQADEQEGAAAALAGWALPVAEDAAAGLETGTGDLELAAARWLDAEDATMRQVLAWAMDHNTAMALRLAAALRWWWFLRARVAGEYPLLREAAGRAEPGGDGWCVAQFCLGWTAAFSADLAGSLGHFTALRDAVADRPPGPALADALAGRSHALRELRRIPEAADDARRALAVSREIGYPVGELLALVGLSAAADFAGDHDHAVRLARRAAQLTAGIPGFLARACSYLLTGVLTDAGDLAAAERLSAAGLAQARDVGDLWNQGALLPRIVDLDLRAGRVEDAAAHLREGLQIAVRTGMWANLLNGLYHCGTLCATTGHHAEALTVWAASDALAGHERFTDPAWIDPGREERRREARQVLGPDQMRAAEERGAAMSWDTAAEYALILTAPGAPAVAPELGKLSARERELVTLVAQGHTNAQIAGQLSISVRTVRSHLDQIRGKTGSRRRADLTRLALQTGLV